MPWRGTPGKKSEIRRPKPEGIPKSEAESSNRNTGGSVRGLDSRFEQMIIVQSLVTGGAISQSDRIEDEHEDEDDLGGAVVTIKGAGLRAGVLTRLSLLDPGIGNLPGGTARILRNSGFLEG